MIRNNGENREKIDFSLKMRRNRQKIKSIKKLISFVKIQLENCKKMKRNTLVSLLKKKLFVLKRKKKEKREKILNFFFNQF